MTTEQTAASTEEQKPVKAPKAKKAIKKAAKKAAKKAVKKSNGVQSGVREGTIAATIIKGIKADKSPEDVLAMVKKEHKGCKTTLPCVYWYRSKLATGGLKA